MTTNESDVIQGALKILNLPDLACYTSYAEAIQAIVANIGVELPQGDLTNVVVGNQQPSNSQLDALWIRKDNSGTFLGIYVYSGGEWVQIYPIGAPAVSFPFCYVAGGTTLNPLPAGWESIETYPDITAPDLAALQANWIADGSGGWRYLQVWLAL